MAERKTTTKRKTKTGRRRSTLGSDPLDALVPETPAKRATSASRRGLSTSSRKRKTSTTKPRKAAAEDKVPKVRATFHLPLDVFDQARDAVYWTPGLTLAELCEKGLRAELAKLEKRNGKPFPPREAELKGGRPVGS